MTTPTAGPATAGVGPSVERTGMTWRLPVLLVDRAIVAFLVFVDLSSVFVILHFRNDGGHHLFTEVGTAVNLIGAIALLWRRKHAATVLGVVVVVQVIALWIRAGAPLFDLPLPLLVAMYTYALNAPTVQVVRFGALVWIVTFTVNALSMGIHGAELLTTSLMPTLVIGVGASLGLYIGTKRKYMDQLHERAERLERERLLLTERAVTAERVRIARELHDVVSHHIALIVVQAGAARTLIDHDPVEGARLIEAVGSSGRQALEEMRRMLGLLRTDSSVDVPMQPSPGLAELGDLVRRSEEAGLSVTLTLHGNFDTVPEPLQLTAFRIVQESLTNVIKHASTATARAILMCGTDSVTVRVSDDGPGADPDALATGQGLVGMRERVSLFGGRLEVTTAPGKGFAIMATLPTKRTGEIAP